MLGIIIGTTLTLGILAFARRRGYARHRSRRGCGHGGHRRIHRDWSYCHGEGDWPYWQKWSYWRSADLGSRNPRRWINMLADRLGATRDQERVIHDAAETLHGELRTLAEEARRTRRDLGGAFGPDRFDEEQMGELFATHDDLLERARKAVVGALSEIHDVLEPAQRERLAQWIGGRRGFGPYRA